MARKRKKTKRSPREEKLVKRLKGESSVENPWALAKAILAGTVDRKRAKRAYGRAVGKKKG